MSAPVFLADDLTAARIVLAGPEGHHAATVRRLLVGEAVDLVDGRGTRASCRVLAVGAGRLEAEVLSRVVEPPPSLRLVLVQAIAKGDRGELAVELATEVGIDEVVPWAAGRSIATWTGARGEKALDRWRSSVRAAVKQSRRSWLPPVSDATTTVAVCARIRAAAAAYVLHEVGTSPLATAQLPEAGEVLLVIGPEGGIRDEEVAAFEQAGARTVRLGPSVLRTSTAGAVAAAVISARSGRWR